MTGGAPRDDDPPPGGRGPEPQPERARERESTGPAADPLTGAAVLGGLVVGVIGSVLYGVLAFGIVGGSGMTGVLAAVGVPALVALALLVFPRTRRAGSGFVMGLALGAIVVAGVCLGPVL